MKWICCRGISVAVLSIVATQSFSSPSVRTIYGLTNAQHFQTKRAGDFYIQLGSFSSKLNATNFQKKLRLKTKFPIVTLQRNGHYAVAIGPVESAAQVRSIGHSLSVSPLVTAKVIRPIKAKPLVTNKIAHHTKPVPAYSPPPKPQKNTSSVVIAPSTSLQGNWFVSAGVGGQFPEFQSTMTVNNGSDFPAPYNKDIYSTNKNSEMIVGAAAGRRWSRNRSLLPAFSLGASYQHFFSGNVGGSVMQHSLPEFKNYNYHWDVSSDVALATTKLNLTQYERISPFINGGVGAAFNNTSGYSETALPRVTPRISPNFTNKTNSNFAYNVGAGLDLKVMPLLILSLGYLYQDLGTTSSGVGTQTWPTQSLSLGSYRTNNVFVSVNYLFNQ